MPTPAPDLPDRPTLLLVGGGHAHIEVLRRLAVEPHPPVRAVLVSPYHRHHYSGMAPGYVAGLYREEELSFDLAALAAAAGCELVIGTATAVHPRERRVELEDGGGIDYDLVSFGVGSRAAGEDVPGVREHALTVKPLSRAVEVRRRVEALAGGGGPEQRCVTVVGAGSAGVETVLAVVRALQDAGAEHDVTLLEGGPHILPRYGDRVRRLVHRALHRHGVTVRTGIQVLCVEEDAVCLQGGGRHPAHLALWMAGPAAPPLFAGSGLPLDGRGYLLVDDTLRAPGHPEVFGGGDCVTPASWRETPKAGVYAVREAPVLWKSLLATLEGHDPAARGVCFEPQRGYLSLLNTCDGRAVLNWKVLSFHHRAAWWLKDWIDRRFVRRYQRLYGEPAA